MFGVFFDLGLNNGWVNNDQAGDLSRHRAHYDVTVIDPTPVPYIVVDQTKQMFSNP